MDKFALTTYLYARPSFVEGLARLIDFGNTLQQYNSTPTAQQADALAMELDWYAVGQDLKNAMLEFDELQSKLPDDLNREAKKILTNSL